jgi:hypothetical protein
MKKCLLIFVLFTNLLFAQKDSLIFKKNDIKFDGFSALVFRNYGLTYERIINNKFSAGISILKRDKNFLKKRLENNINNRVLDWQFNPYVRYAFSSVENKNFFYAEIFGSINSLKTYSLNRYIENNLAFYKVEKDIQKNIGLGASIGYKEYFFYNLIFDAQIGFGLNNNQSENEAATLIPRIGLCLGYNF